MIKLLQNMKIIHLSKKFSSLKYTKYRLLTYTLTQLYIYMHTSTYKHIYIKYIMALFMLMIIYQLMSTFKSVMAELPLQAIYFLFPLCPSPPPPEKNILFVHSHKPIAILGKNVTNHHEERLRTIATLANAHTQCTYLPFTTGSIFSKTSPKAGKSFFFFSKIHSALNF